MPVLTPRHLTSRAAGRLTALAGAIATTATLLVGLAAAPAAAAVPAAPVALPTAIESLAPYQPQRTCDPVAKPGTKALAHLLTSTYSGTAIVSLTRPCGSDTSEHYDGRAIDWGVDHRNDHQRALGKKFLSWLFAADDSGDRYAMVRRLGVMYIIWNKRIWGSYDQSWEPYSCSGVTACHVDHMHISLDWSGAMKKTSFWTGVVRPPMNPPLVALKATGRTETITVSPRDGDPTPVYALVAGGRYRLTVSGAYHYDGAKHHRADAACATTDGRHWTRRAPSGTAGDLDVWVNDRHRWHSATAGAGRCDPQHRYRRTVTVADRTPLTATVADDFRWDDSGDLTLSVRRVG